MAKRLEMELVETQLKDRDARKDDFKNYSGALDIKRERKWLYSRGKGHVLDFTEKEIQRLRECFMELDEDHGGSIGLDELEGPLIGLGIAQTRDEVEDMIMSVDDDGEIQFEEFLEIVKGGGSSSDTVKITQFFKDLISGKLQGSEGETDLSFNMIVGNFRREHMMNAVLKHDTKNLD